MAEKSYCYRYPRPVVTTDCVVLGWGKGSLKVLLVQRGKEPFQGSWALPGGFLEMEEDAESGARRELKEETGIEGICMEQLYAFATVDRDPRYRVISIAFTSLVALENCKAGAGDDAARVEWFPLEKMPGLAFDHRCILQKALNRWQMRSRYYPLGREALPEWFTMDELRQLYEAIRDVRLEEITFREHLLRTGIVEEQKTEGDISIGKRKYRFIPERYERGIKEGFEFKI